MKLLAICAASSRIRYGLPRKHPEGSRCRDNPILLRCSGGHKASEKMDQPDNHPHPSCLIESAHY
jgi:hypothetical protein